MVRQKSQTNGLSKVVQYELAVGIHLIEPVQTKLSIPQCGPSRSGISCCVYSWTWWSVCFFLQHFWEWGQEQQWNEGDLSTHHRKKDSSSVSRLENFSSAFGSLTKHTMVPGRCAATGEDLIKCPVSGTFELVKSRKWKHVGALVDDGDIFLLSIFSFLFSNEGRRRRHVSNLQGECLKEERRVSVDRSKTGKKLRTLSRYF